MTRARISPLPVTVSERNNHFTRGEAIVLDLYDAGLDRPKIARKLGLSNARVHSILSTYAHDDGTGTKPATMEAASQRLLAAIQKARGA